MRFCWWLCLVGLACRATCCAAQDQTSPQVASAAESPRGDFLAMYNGKDLSGWATRDLRPQSWQAQGESLVCFGQAGWLRTEALYSDFVLRFEYHLSAAGNSGIAVRVPAAGDPAMTGIEIELLDDTVPEAQAAPLAKATGSILGLVPARQRVSKASPEWNVCEVTCRGSSLAISINGEVINEVSLEESKSADGGGSPLSERPRAGFVALQGQASPVQFRNMQIKDLTTSTKSGLRYLDLVIGDGAVITPEATVTVHHTGWLLSGRKVDSSRDRDEPAVLSLKETIPGWSEGVAGMKVGGRRKLVVPPELAYGERGVPPLIPGNATLVFDLEVLGLNE